MHSVDSPWCLESHLSLSWYLTNLSRSRFTLALPFLYQPPAKEECCSPCCVVSCGLNRIVTEWPPSSVEKIRQDLSVLSWSNEPRHFSRLCGNPQTVIFTAFLGLEHKKLRSSEILCHFLLESRGSSAANPGKRHEMYTSIGKYFTMLVYPHLF